MSIKMKRKWSTLLYSMLLIITMMVLNSNSIAFASGVPVTMGSLSNSFYGTGSTSTWQGPGYWIYTSYSTSWDTGTTAGGNLDLNAGSTGGYYVALQGSTDNVNWTGLDGGDLGSPNYQTDFQSYTSGTYRYFRVYAQSYNGYPSISCTVTVQKLGIVADQSTAQSASDNASAANSAAQAAQAAANSASTAAQQSVNWLNGTWGGYDLGTIGANAVAANGNASNAATQASNAYNQGVTTNNYLTDGTNGLTAIKNQVTSAYNQSLANNSQLTNSTYGLSAINSNITTTNTNVTNLANNMQYLIPPVLTKVFGYNGATATSTTSFNVSMNYSGATEYQYQVDGGLWSGWTPIGSYTSSGYFTVPVSSTGQHSVNVNLRNNNGAGIVSAVSSGQVTFFKL